MNFSNLSLVGLAAFTNGTRMQDLSKYILYHNMLTSLLPSFQNLPDEMKNDLISTFLSSENSDCDSSFSDIDSTSSANSGDTEMPTEQELLDRISKERRYNKRKPITESN